MFQISAGMQLATVSSWRFISKMKIVAYLLKEPLPRELSAGRGTGLRIDFGVQGVSINPEITGIPFGSRNRRDVSRMTDLPEAGAALNPTVSREYAFDHAL